MDPSILTFNLELLNLERRALGGGILTQGHNEK
jgi:hypothetical protein